ncbi:M61 family metallopeptidase [Pedobacter sp. L105]|uniref:M61 family metallopeptidase n=1 Tax=Pedobacter sp. L105 TaxID=1641871 RepID=UPI0020B15920|nr:PDZ domain-containing protein [Pedobacter sp. L105]
MGLVLILIWSIRAQAGLKIDFEVSFKEPQAHYVEVQMNISGLAKDYIDVKMPVWAPGSYLIREFSKNVEGFAAADGVHVLSFQKLKKNTWRVYKGNSSSIQLKYRVYAFEVSVRTPFIDGSHAFLSPTGIFMYPDKGLSLESTVKIIPFAGWSKVSTGLKAIPGKDFTYVAKNFDILYDSPIEVGNQEVIRFNAAGVKHEVAMYGGGNYDAEKLKLDMARIIEQLTAIYGENPNENYTFIVHNLSRGGGGLEHSNSAVLGVGRDTYGSEEGYKGFLSLVAHEYHHLWNVKRLRPIALGPFDYENENYTTDLWIAEGFTAYYENKIMLRAGFLSPDEYLSTLINALSAVMNTPGAKVQSMAEASFDAWIKYYRPNENSNNSSVSYYNKGEIAGMLMDLEISHATGGTRSLDDVMKAMYTQCKLTGKGYSDEEFKAMAEKISGISFTDFWAKYVDGTATVEYAKYFGYAGIKVVDANEGKSIPYLGLASRKTDGHIYIIAVSRNSSAWVDGLNVGDEVISIGDLPAEAPVERMAALLSKKVGDVISVKIKRDESEMVIKVTIKANPNVKLEPSMDTPPSEIQKKILRKWMGI